MNNESIKFSIITVCYNEEKKIQSTIESVLSQNWQNYEYIIVDGQSTDATMEIVRKYAEKEERIWWQSEKDNGIYNAMNKGIRYAKGDFLCFLNAGDVLYSDEVLKTVAARIEESNADIIFGDRVRKELGQINRTLYPEGGKLPEYLKSKKNICHQAIFASKDSLKEGFDEQFKICADYDWLCRQVNVGLRIAKVDSVVVDFDVCGVSSKSQYRKLSLKESLKIVRKNFPDMEVWKYDEVEKILLQNVKNHMMYRNMVQWLRLKQKGVDISSYFMKRDIYSIAIYGFHYMGQRLYDELKDSLVKVAYVIDKNSDAIISELPIVQMDAMPGNVDAIIVTPILDFTEIKEALLKKVDCTIISIEDVLFGDCS